MWHVNTRNCNIHWVFIVDINLTISNTIYLWFEDFANKIMGNRYNILLFYKNSNYIYQEDTYLYLLANIIFLKTWFLMDYVVCKQGLWLWIFAIISHLIIEIKCEIEIVKNIYQRMKQANKKDLC